MGSCDFGFEFGISDSGEGGGQWRWPEDLVVAC